MVVSRGWREGALLLNRYRVFVLEDERGMGMNGGDAFAATGNVFNTAAPDT